MLLSNRIWDEMSILLTSLSLRPTVSNKPQGAESPQRMGARDYRASPRQTLQLTRHGGREPSIRPSRARTRSAGAAIYAGPVCS